MLMSWSETVALLQAAAAKRGGDTFVRDALVVLSPRGEGATITIRDDGPDGVFLEAGWVVRLVAARDQYPDEPPYFLQIVEAIMDGQAAESAIIDTDGNWTDVAFTITSPHGTTGGQPDPRPRVTRLLPAWN
jgi:hypothetical protein